MVPLWKFCSMLIFIWIKMTYTTVIHVKWILWAIFHNAVIWYQLKWDFGAKKKSLSQLVSGVWLWFKVELLLACLLFHIIILKYGKSSIVIVKNQFFGESIRYGVPWIKKRDFYKTDVCLNNRSHSL